MARFAQYALAASEEALDDAGWMRTTADQKEATVCIDIYSMMSEL